MWRSTDRPELSSATRDLLRGVTRPPALAIISFLLTSHSQTQVALALLRPPCNLVSSFTATTDAGPATATTTIENRDKDSDSIPNGEAQVTSEGKSESDPENHALPDSEKKNGEFDPADSLDGENNQRPDTIFSAKKVTLPPRSAAAAEVAGEMETEETEAIPTYDLSTGENITNVLESEILENNQDIIESNGDCGNTQE